MKVIIIIMFIVNVIKEIMICFADSPVLLTDCDL